AVKAWQIALQETLQTQPALSDISRGNFGIGQQSLRGRLFEQRHPCRSPIGLFLSRVSGLAYRFEKKGYSPTKRTRQNRSDPMEAQPFRILSLDGGGIMGERSTPPWYAETLRNAKPKWMAAFAAPSPFTASRQAHGALQPVCRMRRTHYCLVPEARRAQRKFTLRKFGSANRVGSVDALRSQSRDSLHMS